VFFSILRLGLNWTHVICVTFSIHSQFTLCEMYITTT